MPDERSHEILLVSVVNGDRGSAGKVVTPDLIPALISDEELA
jgi:hypothetical protein